MQHQTGQTSLVAVLEDLNEHTLPRLMDMREKLNNGETVGELELNFFHNSLENLQYYYQQYQDDEEALRIFAQLSGLLQDLSKKLLENEKRASEE